MKFGNAVRKLKAVWEERGLPPFIREHQQAIRDLPWDRHYEGKEHSWYKLDDDKLNPLQRNLVRSMMMASTEFLIPTADQGKSAYFVRQTTEGDQLAAFIDRARAPRQR